MAKIYLYGYGTVKNNDKALELMKKAAGQNYPDALFALSVIYTEGVLVEKDLNKAFELMEKAAMKELPSAQFNLGGYVRSRRRNQTRLLPSNPLVQKVCQIKILRWHNLILL